MEVKDLYMTILRKINDSMMRGVNNLISMQTLH